VSTVEVVAVTVHTLTTVVMMSVFGAFFALFTRSPTLATAAAASYSVPFFALYPGIYVVATGNPLASAHFSTFAAPAAQDWSALLPPLSFLPSVLLTLRLAAPLFQQKVSAANIQKAFSEEVWRSRTWGILLGGWFVVGVLTLPWMTPCRTCSAARSGRPAPPGSGSACSSGGTSRSARRSAPGRSCGWRWTSSTGSTRCSPGRPP
jgi:hypothetical protein